MSRRKAREVALQVLFHVDVGRADPEFALRQAMAEEELDPAVIEFAARLVRGTVAHLADIDALLGSLAHDWSLKRMANIDRNVLRLAVFEIVYGGDVPPGVAVNEAVELAKIFSTADSGKFVNGILGALVRQRQASEELR